MTPTAATFPNPQPWFPVILTTALQGKSHMSTHASEIKNTSHHLYHPSRWKVVKTSPCSVSCDLGIAERNVSCVQFIHGRESVVSDDQCRVAVKPATAVPCLVKVCTYRWEVKPWSQVHSTGWKFKSV